MLEKKEENDNFFLTAGFVYLYLTSLYMCKWGLEFFASDFIFILFVILLLSERKWEQKCFISTSVIGSSALTILDTQIKNKTDVKAFW